MTILVFNAGSSSLKCGIFDLQQEDSRIFKAEFERFDAQGCQLHFRCGGEGGERISRQENCRNVEEAIEHVPALLKECGYQSFSAVGHRIAHGGERFQEATRIDDAVLEQIDALTPLAPLHNPANLAAVRLSRRLWPDIPHVAVFDTAFHLTMPESAYTYAVPKAWREKGLRRYGFHGTSHKYVALRIAKAMRQPVTELKLISCHLGNGASVCAINRGFSIDTSMGMTPLEGLVMGTRSGDVDPGIFGYLSREMGLSAPDIESALYRESGLKAIAGTHDLRDIEEKAAAGDADAQLAIHLYAYRVRKYIGAYTAAMGGVDAIAFTGGIGEHSPSMRRRICDRLHYLGLYLDDPKNQAVRLQGDAAIPLHSPDARVQVWVTQTAEQWMIAKETEQLLTRESQTTGISSRIPVAVSARHVHLSQDAVETLFGPGYQLQKYKDLSQPEGWAAKEQVSVIGPKGTLEHVRVLGPTRSRTQIEVSKTDTFTLGLEAPVRPSGMLEHTPQVTLRGPAGELITDGLIIAARHIHMHPRDAERLGLQDGDYVNVRLGDADRDLLFNHTLVRVKESYVTEMHIDTDEANAAGITMRTDGELILNNPRQEGAIVERLDMNLNHHPGREFAA